MSALIDVILPVFLIIGFGYLAARAQWISGVDIDGVMRFAQGFATPVLLFKSIAALDLSTSFQPGLLVSFYLGAFIGFGFGFLLAHYVFGRALPDSVSIGFVCLFSNTLLLGLPITERAYGPGALAGNFAIISLHAPVIYAFGIMAMEWALAKQTGGKGIATVARQILKGIATQPLVIGLGLGFVVNFLDFQLPAALLAAVNMVASSAIPAALFGLGGVLYRYRPEGDAKLVATVVFASLILHPTVTYLMGRFVFVLDIAALRSSTLTSAMPPGVNAYLFAFMFGVGKRVAATSILTATALSVVTVWIWLHILP
jgi:malonate transporter